MGIALFTKRMMVVFGWYGYAEHNITIKFIWQVWVSTKYNGSNLQVNDLSLT